MRDYPGCDKCGSKEVDGYDLLVNNKLVCRDCLIKKTGGRSSGALSWTEQQKWHQKHWGINISEWLDAYDCLPVNANCATKWLKDKQHLSNCACLELEAKELHELFTNSLREKEEKIKKCRCKASNKPRTPYYDYDNYGYTYCEKCEKRIKGAGKHGTIKNRNNPAFWGLNIPQKVLCGECLANYLKNMPTRKKYLFNEYVKRGYWK
ncbi:hypothetical protein [endosymbiont GvMRE of Glomus versiforme]|uniref:hypothetical protein n=1 Tax=endosymbiont GvMRE of Glomus versiforme TaxID=2039283 RepID=UPI0011C3B384|nr:hypothetical protein [endosymbiont GvMRE of Glomus versiforme]